MLHFRFRWNISLDQIRELERARIMADDEFLGPRPTWAGRAADS